jgi:protein mago nashi
MSSKRNKPNEDEEMKSSKFYCRYYVGHKGRFGHEFLEFEVRHDGRVRYANNSNYKSDLMIRKEVYVNFLVVDQFKQIVASSGISKQSDESWPEPDREGTQELEIFFDDGEELLLNTKKIGSMSEVNSSEDPQGLGKFYYLVQDLKCLVFSIINLHFRVKPV